MTTLGPTQNEFHNRLKVIGDVRNKQKNMLNIIVYHFKYHN